MKDVAAFIGVLAVVSLGCYVLHVADRQTGWGISNVLLGVAVGALLLKRLGLS